MEVNSPFLFDRRVDNFMMGDSHGKARISVALCWDQCHEHPSADGLYSCCCFFRYVLIRKRRRFVCTVAI